MSQQETGDGLQIAARPAFFEDEGLVREWSALPPELLEVRWARTLSCCNCLRSPCARRVLDKPSVGCPCMRLSLYSLCRFV